MCVFEVLFNGVSTLFGLPLIENSFKNHTQRFVRPSKILRLGAIKCVDGLFSLPKSSFGRGNQTPKSPIKRCSYGHETPIGRQNGQSGFGDFGDWGYMLSSCYHQWSIHHVTSVCGRVGPLDLHVSIEAGLACTLFNTTDP